MTIGSSKPLILWIEEARSSDIQLVGGKAASLGELARAGMPIPPGFVITSEAYRIFLEETGLKTKIVEILKDANVNNREWLEKVSAQLRKLIIEAPIPKKIEEVVKTSYRKLATKLGIKEPLVAVRSSATAEDLPEISFAGQQDTYLNVKGEDAVVEKVKAVWASLFTPRAIVYREHHRIPHENVSMAVIVQKMVNARSAGVLFTIHPATGSEDVILIESAWGLGEAVVAGKVTPDEFIVDKRTLKIIEKRINKKEIAIVYDPSTGRNVEVKLPEDKAYTPSLKDEEIIELARYGIMIENHYNHPVDIEWAIDADLTFPKNLFILQARHETVWSKSKRRTKPIQQDEKVGQTQKVLVKGLPASPGVATGTARVIIDPHSLEANEFHEGDILVTKMTDPDWVPLMKKAAAIVTDEGGMTSHAAIVSRELGIPAVVGTKDATKVIKTGMTITVDGSRGIVYEGRIKLPDSGKIKAEVTGFTTQQRVEVMELYPITATKIYMNLGEPNAIDKYLHLPFDGIGLMRIEFILSDWIGYHPLYLIEAGRESYFVEKLTEGIAKVAGAIYPKPVVVRFSDFKTNEYKRLMGGEKFEPEERNPMIGWRGVSRYIHPLYEKAFRLEVRAVKKVRQELGLKNVWVMLPSLEQYGNWRRYWK